MRDWIAVSVIALMACADGNAFANDISIERVFGPETPTGRYKHPASITELANGDLYLAWYGGDGEYKPGTAVWGSRWTAQSNSWSTPAKLAADPFYSVGNPVIWQAPDGLLWLWYVLRPGETWSTSRIAVKISRDNAQTWSDASILSFEEGTMVRGKPIVLSDGTYALPVWKETGYDTEIVGADTASFVLLYDPSAKKWTGSTRIHGRVGALQPALAQLDMKHLIAYCRRGGGYGPTSSGFIIRSESADGGRTWSEGRDTKLPNPNAAVDLLRLTNGHLLLHLQQQHAPPDTADSSAFDRWRPDVSVSARYRDGRSRLRVSVCYPDTGWQDSHRIYFREADRD